MKWGKNTIYSIVVDSNWESRRNKRGMSTSPIGLSREMSKKSTQLTRSILDMFISASQFSFDNPSLFPLCCFTLHLFIGLPFAVDFTVIVTYC